jgi:UDP-N-acetylglucosamine--N-acetylmuramyl-(pentapeptide) pyrophosphoryl-undecaprenol N-acetylglucosamine transferase
MASELKCVLIMAGGTGGHVFPGLAVAKLLREKGVEVHWLGTEQGLESRLVPEANLPLHLITISGLRGKGLKPLLTAPFKIVKAISQSIRIMKQIHPDVVIGMGGFVSGPGGIASWLLRRPLIIHEQNAKAGLTNKMLAYLAKRVLEGFPGTFKARAKVVDVGNPVRAEIAALLAPDKRLLPSHSPLRLLVLGGSLGARALNDILPGALATLDAADRPSVLHQTGDKHFETTKDAYASKGVEADLKPFIKEMAQAYSWADVVLCRAGALTVAELCAVGLGAIFVPFPYAVDDHQTANADFMVKHGAGQCIQQTELTESRLADIVRDLTRQPEKRLAMAQAAYQLRNVKVTEKIVDICREVCR